LPLDLDRQFAAVPAWNDATHEREDRSTDVGIAWLGLPGVPIVEMPREQGVFEDLLRLGPEQQAPLTSNSTAPNH
jgi:hypothetical protein